MSEINTFIEAARKKNLNDATIRAALVAEGWNDTVITAALAGLDVPKSSASKDTPQQSHSNLSPLLSALQHLFLWFFVGASIPAIITITSFLFGLNTSVQQLRIVGAIALTSFAIYVAFYAVYLSKLRKMADLAPNRILSIITICLHSIMALIATYTLIIAFISAYSSDITKVSAAFLLALALIVIVTYTFAGFVFTKKKLRKVILFIHIPLIIVLYGVFGILAFMQSGARAHDEQLRQDLTSAAQAVKTYTEEHDSLPTKASDLNLKPGVTYNKKTDTTYSVCGAFQSTTNSSPYTYPSSNPYYSSDLQSGASAVRPNTQSRLDYSVYESMFYANKTGNTCFDFQSYSLRNKNLKSKQSIQPKQLQG